MLCRMGKVSGGAYYKWVNRSMPANEKENWKIADEIEKIHTESPDKGYRRIKDDLERYYDRKVNDKRVLRICRKKGIKSTIKYSNHGCTRQASNPQFIAENVLNRESAILDLYDRRIVSYVIDDSNNNPLVFRTFDAAIADNPGATPLCHSDRGFQYTNRAFHAKLAAA